MTKGYKVFNKNLMCKGFQFEIGETYEHEGEIELCESGFHFCTKLVDCFSYYDFNPENKVCEVECEGVSEQVEDDSKRVCRKIHILKELSWYEVLDLVNIGKNNTGFGNSGNANSGNRNSGYGNSGNGNSGNANSGNANSGNRNSGDGNSGDGNSGNRNSGNRNSGYGNSGNRNSGNRNSGYGNSGYGNSGNRNSGYGNSGNRNSGHRNSGDRNSGNANSGNGNSGNRNSGHGNSGDGNSGCFNTIDAPMILFNTVLDMTVTEFWNKYHLPILPILVEDKNGELITNDYKLGWEKAWDIATNEQRQTILNLPHFDATIFEEITGIKV